MGLQLTADTDPVNRYDVSEVSVSGDGLLGVHWIHGSASAKHNADPDIQVHDTTRTFVLRQNMAVHYEAPFMFLVFGRERAVLIDTGATKSAEFFLHRATVDDLIARHDGPHELLVLHTHSHGDHVAADA